MNRKLIGLVTSLVLATVGTLLIVGYVRGIEGRAMAEERVVPVLVVKTAIPEGTAAADLAAFIAREEVPAKVRAEGAVDALGDLEGLVTAIDLVPGEQLTNKRFLSPEAAAAAQGVQVPEGLLEVTVALDASRVVGGQIMPGDTVAVLGSFADGASDGEDAEDAGGDGQEGANGSTATTHVLLHKVLVTDLRTETAEIAAPDEKQPEAEATAGIPGAQIYVTLAVDAPSVERVVYTAEFGSLWLAQEPEDAPENGTRIQRSKTIYEKTTSR